MLVLGAWYTGLLLSSFSFLCFFFFSSMPIGRGRGLGVGFLFYYIFLLFFFSFLGTAVDGSRLDRVPYGYKNTLKKDLLLVIITHKVYSQEAIRLLDWHSCVNWLGCY